MAESEDQESRVPSSARATQLPLVFGRPQFQHDKLIDYRARLQAALAGGHEIPPAQRIQVEAHIRLIDDYFATQEAVALLEHGFKVAEQRRQVVARDPTVTSDQQIKAQTAAQHASLQAEQQLHAARARASEAELALNRAMGTVDLTPETLTSSPPRAPHPDPRFGEALARSLGYQSVTPLSEGGFGVVCEAVDFAGRRHALKLLYPSPFVNAAAAEPRFRREAHAILHLDHPRIVKYERMGSVDGWWYLEMELVIGKTLMRWIDDGRTWRERLHAIVQLLEALEHAHEHGVYHRDVKPDNLMIRDDGSAVLIDFGLAWVTGRVDSTLTTSTAWSLDYAPPEVREAASNSRGPQHDIYSAGVVLYQAMAGRRPSVPTTSLAEVAPALAALDPVIDRALAPPARRYTSACAFRDALVEVFRTLP